MAFRADFNFSGLIEICLHSNDNSVAAPSSDDNLCVPPVVTSVKCVVLAYHRSILLIDMRIIRK